MKTLKLAILSALLSIGAFAQTALTATTLSAAITSSQRQVVVASATGITAGNTMLYIDNEAMSVNAVSGTTITVGPRGGMGTKASGHISGAMVLAGPPPAFIQYDPAGFACTAGQGLSLYTPVVNVTNGNQWLCSTILAKFVPGWNNGGDPPAVTTAVASAAGLITPSGPLFHITGALAITGFNIPVGFDPKGGGTLCAIPDGAFTTTTANNIAIASTAVVSKVLCWAYDANTAKFYPYY